MQNAAASPQEPPTEPRDQNVAVRCTATEKRAIQFLALALDTSESELMRDRTMAEIVIEAERRRALASV